MVDSRAMSTPAPPVTPPLTAGDARLVFGAVAFAVAIAAFVWFTMFPRFEIFVVNEGKSILIHDRWGGRIQRADYDEQGDPTLKRMLTPF